MTSDEDLDLVETERLIDALGRRFDCVVVGTVADLNGQAEERGIGWRGGFTAAIGLTTFMDKRFAAMIAERASAGAEDDRQDTDVEDDDDDT